MVFLGRRYLIVSLHRVFEYTPEDKFFNNGTLFCKYEENHDEIKKDKLESNKLQKR